jgi:hypothetical protein
MSLLGQGNPIQSAPDPNGVSYFPVFQEHFLGIRERFLGAKPASES